MPLVFTSDLVVETGGAVGRVTGEGARLRVTTDDPGRFVDELRAVGTAGIDTGTRGVRRVAEFLADQGVSLVITGPRGDVLTVGAEASSRLGRLLAGTPRVAPGRVGAAAPLVRGQVRDLVRTRTGRAALAAAVLLAVGLLGRHRKWPSPPWAQSGR